MKKLFLLLFVATFILFTSCDKEEPYSLSIDLQNGYWEVEINTFISVLKFDTSTVNSYWIEGITPCIDITSNQAYTLVGNIL